MKVTHNVVILILCIIAAIGLTGTIYFCERSNELTAQIEQMKKQHSIEMQSVIDSPYAPIDYYIEQIDKLQDENAQLKEQLNN